MLSKLILQETSSGEKILVNSEKIYPFANERDEMTWKEMVLKLPEDHSSLDKNTIYLYINYIRQDVRPKEGGGRESEMRSTASTKKPSFPSCQTKIKHD